MQEHCRPGTHAGKVLVAVRGSKNDVPYLFAGIKVLRQQNDIGGFAAQQHRILEGVWPLLAAGGRLLYATCSVLAEENGAVVEQFTSLHPDAAFLPLPTDGGIAIGHGRQLLPTDQGPDGLFYALLEKRSLPASQPVFKAAMCTITPLPPLQSVRDFFKVRR